MVSGVLPDELELRRRLLLVLRRFGALGVFCRQRSTLQTADWCPRHLRSLDLQFLGGALVIIGLRVEVGLPRSLGGVLEGAYWLPRRLRWA